VSNKENQNIFDVIKYDEKGLIPAIVQNYEDNQILMFAWMNQESLKLTLKTNFAHYFSRSRNKLWRKGEISGQVQEIKEILIDCDSDCLILKVSQKGVACHTGTKSCFFRNVDDNGALLVNQKPQISSNILYNKK
jgi:phosphoribosyl-ATP pyrophosphohydrolase/phosphoribosyl-AMP cyclohydrolase